MGDNADYHLHDILERVFFQFDKNLNKLEKSEKVDALIQMITLSFLIINSFRLIDKTTKKLVAKMVSNFHDHALFKVAIHYLTED